MVLFIQTRKQNTAQGHLRLGYKDTVIPAGCTAWVKCKVLPQLDSSESLVLFEPIESGVPLQFLGLGKSLLEIQLGNTPCVMVPFESHTKHDSVLAKSSAVDNMQSIKKVETELVLGDVETDKVTVASAEAQSPQTLGQPPVDLSHLEKEQQAIMAKMLYEECAAFAKDTDDLGFIPILQISLCLKDAIPIQKAYPSIPKPLFAEVIEYIKYVFAEGGL